MRRGVVSLAFALLFVAGCGRRQDGARSTTVPVRTGVDNLIYVSWGDQIIADCSNGLPVKNGHTKWIAYDTSHHLAFVVEEVREFERVLVSTASATTA